MTKPEAEKIVALFEESQHDEDVTPPNPAQVRIARKVLSGKIKEGEVLTEHPVTHEACEASEAARVRKCLKENLDWKNPENGVEPKDAA